MKGIYRNSSVFVLGLALCSVSAGQPTRGEPAQPCPQITIRVFDFAQLLAETQGAARREAGKVLRRAGVSTIWVDCPLSPEQRDSYPACREPLTPADIVLRILPQSMVPDWARGTALFGYALPGKQGEFGVRADVFSHRVKDLAAKLRALPEGRIFSSGVILGHVVAHELGHLLLGAGSHSRSGIMSFPWGPRQLHETTRGGLLFTRPQAARLQAAVQARLRAAGAARPRIRNSSAR